jgi:hypothetical protein
MRDFQDGDTYAHIEAFSGKIVTWTRRSAIWTSPVREGAIVTDRDIDGVLGMVGGTFVGGRSEKMDGFAMALWARNGVVIEGSFI